MEYWNVSGRMRDVVVYRKPVRRVDPVFLYLVVYDLIIMLKKSNKNIYPVLSRICLFALIVIMSLWFRWVRIHVYRHRCDWYMIIGSY